MREYYLVPADCLEALRKMRPDSIDSMVTDPPYGWAFMGKEWDSVANSKSYERWTESWAREVYRVLKPGGHILVFCGPRTYHRMASGVEDAGFEIRDQMQWLFGSGFPKSLDISKAIDKAAGAEREVVGYKKQGTHSIFDGGKPRPATLPATEWSGWGTALKPANEPILLARKPLSEKTVVANVLKWGTGGINIDGCRVTSATPIETGRGKRGDTGMFSPAASDEREYQTQGRFPANLVLSHDEGCSLDIKKLQEAVLWASPCGQDWIPKEHHPSYETIGKVMREALAENTGNCTPTCAVKMLDEQSGMLHPAGNKKPSGTKGSSIFGIGLHEHQRSIDSKGGGASRFFYCAKASKSERNLGCEGLEEKEEGIDDPRPSGQSMQRLDGRDPRAMTNHHPTVKPLKLMRYLCRLITPPGGAILDPFMGSGSTGVAALQEGFSFIGIEREQDYFKIALSRLRYEIFKEDDTWLKERKPADETFKKVWSQTLLDE